jgi:hypothetical protein
MMRRPPIRLRRSPRAPRRRPAARPRRPRPHLRRPPTPMARARRPPPSPTTRAGRRARGARGARGASRRRKARATAMSPVATARPTRASLWARPRVRGPRGAAWRTTAPVPPTHATKRPTVADVRHQEFVRLLANSGLAVSSRRGLSAPHRTCTATLASAPRTHAPRSTMRAPAPPMVAAGGHSARARRWRARTSPTTRSASPSPAATGPERGQSRCYCAVALSTQLPAAPPKPSMTKTMNCPSSSSRTMRDLLDPSASSLQASSLPVQSPSSA